MNSPITMAQSLKAVNDTLQFEAGSSNNAGVLSGTETIAISRGTGLLQTTSQALANLALSSLAPQRQSIPVLANGQAAYVTQGYSIGIVNVFVAGIRLNPSQYQALDGVNIVITDPTVLANLVQGMTVDIDASISVAVSGVATPASVQALLATNQPSVATLTGAELFSISQTGALFQSTLTKVAQWVMQTYQSFKQAGSASVSRTAQAKMSDWISVLDYGATGNGVTNDSVAIQACIDYVTSTGGGVVYFPKGKYLCNVILKQGVTLMGASGHFGYMVDGTLGPLYGAQLIQAAAGFVVDTPSTVIRTCSVQGLTFQGQGAAVAGGAVRFQNVKWGSMKQCSANNFADQGFQHVAGFGVVFEDILTTNVLLNRTRAAVSGCVESLGTDNFLTRIEANPSLTVGGGVSSANLYCAAILLGGANSFMTDCIGEDADRGLYVAPLVGAGHRITNCRFDSNVGIGVYVDGSAQWSNVFAYNNSTASSGTYSGFYVSSTATGNIFMGCRSNGSSASVLQKYGFEDYVNNSSPNVRSSYIGCAGAYYSLGLFLTQGFLGSGVIAPPQAIRPADGTAIIDMTGTSMCVLAQYATATTVTNFTGGAEGETIEVLGSSKVTIANNATIATPTGANVVLANNTMYSFTQYNGVWYMNPTNMATPPVSAKNVLMNTLAASASATFTATEVVVAPALGGASTKLANLNVTVNLGTVGANGMDTGTAPVSGFVAVYAIYNPTTATLAGLATNATSSAVGEVYTGANMPAGYTSSVLIAVVPTNASSQFAICSVMGRIVSFVGLTMQTLSSVQSTVTIVNNLVVPLNAIRCSGSIQISVTAAGQVALWLYATAAGSGGKPVALTFSGAGSDAGVFENLSLTVPQRAYYTFTGSGGTLSGIVTVSSYEF